MLCGLTSTNYFGLSKIDELDALLTLIVRRLSCCNEANLTDKLRVTWTTSLCFGVVDKRRMNDTYIMRNKSKDLCYSIMYFTYSCDWAHYFYYVLLQILMCIYLFRWAAYIYVKFLKYSKDFISNTNRWILKMNNWIIILNRWIIKSYEWLII